MASPSRQSEGIGDLIEALEKAAKVPARQRAQNISGVVDRLCQKAYDEGIATTWLNKLIDIITLPNHLDQGSMGTLIRNLYPASRVLDAIVIRVVGSLGHGRAKPSYTSQALLLKWVVMVYDILENPNILLQLYSVLFNLLDTAAIRPQLCHVLALITRRKHVRPYRIQVLMELTQQAGSEPGLVGLMRIYQDYFPHIIVTATTSRRAAVFTHPDQEWRERLGKIQETHLQRTQHGLSPEKRAFRVARKSVVGTTRTSLVLPEVHTSHTHKSSVTLEEIETVDDFVGKLEKIQAPDQLVAVIEDPLLQKYLQLSGFEAESERIDGWLVSFFAEQLCNERSGEANILKVLHSIHEYASCTKEIPSGCYRYLQAILPDWDGMTGREVILALLAYTPISPFQELLESTLHALEDGLFGSNTELLESRVLLLRFYRSLLDQWTSKILSMPGGPDTAAFIKLSITPLMEHMNALALTIAECTSEVIIHSLVLDYYESAAFLISQNSLQTTIRVIIPPPELVHIILFTSSLSNISRLCSILAIYKDTLKAHVDRVPNMYKKDVLNSFNGYIMDICNLVWRMKAFSTEQNALGCLLSPPTVSKLTTYTTRLSPPLSLPLLFAPSLSPVLSNLGNTHFRALEDAHEDEIEKRHPGPVTPKSLEGWRGDGGLLGLTWAEYKTGVLLDLRGRGVSGLWALMRITIKALEGMGEGAK